HRRFEDRFGLPIIETMGLTETGAQILTNPMPPATRKIGSPGTAVGNEVIIGDESQAEVARGTTGEILIRGANVMTGYLHQPEETAKTITAEGWLRTGDLGHMDEDGFVFVTGRIKELIIKGGENIAPREVDEVLLEHDDILEAAAFAVSCDNYGQRVEACIRYKPGHETSEGDLLDHCVARLGKFKAPDRVHVLDDLPKGPSGKVQRLKLHDMVYGGDTG
ncbi:MAG: AMP-binding protein, partial [Pseudomonadota bacterium]|nr:AMP-binding protein [Pseudomonadota bacterium]